MIDRPFLFLHWHIFRTVLLLSYVLHPNLLGRAKYLTHKKVSSNGDNNTIGIVIDAIGTSVIVGSVNMCSKGNRHGNINFLSGN